MTNEFANKDVGEYTIIGRGRAALPPAAPAAAASAAAPAAAAPLPGSQKKHTPTKFSSFFQAFS